MLRVRGWVGSGLSGAVVCSSAVVLGFVPKVIPDSRARVGVAKVFGVPSGWDDGVVVVCRSSPLALASWLVMLFFASRFGGELLVLSVWKKKQRWVGWNRVKKSKFLASRSVGGGH